MALCTDVVSYPYCCIVHRW